MLLNCIEGYRTVDPESYFSGTRPPGWKIKFVLFQRKFEIAEEMY